MLMCHGPSVGNRKPLRHL